MAKRNSDAATRSGGLYGANQRNNRHVHIDHLRENTSSAAPMPEDIEEDADECTDGAPADSLPLPSKEALVMAPPIITDQGREDEAGSTSMTDIKEVEFRPLDARENMPVAVGDVEQARTTESRCPRCKPFRYRDE